MTLIVLMLPAIALWGWDIIENWRARESVRLVYIIGLIGGLGTVGIQLYVMRQPHGEKEFRENYMADPTRCGRCGYNLTGNTSGVCPECGWTLTDTQG